MREGDILQASVWITGDEPFAIRQQYEQDVKDAISDTCHHVGMEAGPVKFTEIVPGTEGIPPVPDHISGSRVRLLLAEAEVIAPQVVTSQGSFVANLEKKDLDRLRLITRQAWAKRHPQDALSDEQCDDYIEELGPEAALDTLRAAHSVIH